MQSVCLYFQVHQPYRLKKYRFFNLGNDHYYYDDYLNKSIMERVAAKSYIPMNNLLLDLIKKYGKKFKVSFSISGMALDQFQEYTPEVLKSFKALAQTGNVEFLAETYAHSLAGMKSKEEFIRQIQMHQKRIKELFGLNPQTFRNTELIYSDDIGETVADLGFKTILTEGAKHILGWKSPNFVYTNAINPRLKVLLRNFQLSDDIAFRFSNQEWSEWPLTTDKFSDWLNNLNPKEQVVNLFMDYETFGEHQWAETGIFEFMRNLPEKILNKPNLSFKTPSEVSKEYQPIAAIQVPNAISWADEERDLTAWLGNEIQDEAFDKLYTVETAMRNCKDPVLQKDWLKLQASDHFYYMCTKWFSDGDVHEYFTPYSSPYEAFINFMNILSDFYIRLDRAGLGRRKRVNKRLEILQEDVFNIVEKCTNVKLKQIIKELNTDELTVLFFESNQNIRDKIMKVIGKKNLKKIQDLRKNTDALSGREIDEYKESIRRKI
ncbi:MAG: glycoside hydrolase family 57 protein [Bacteroidales bacterium]|nr:glycoside hydrolase family 57 protein [Bacteroidales bacterium]RLD39481.1 MAG: alpha-amylase [Bacteroidota bacterium]